MSYKLFRNSLLTIVAVLFIFLCLKLGMMQSMCDYVSHNVLGRPHRQIGTLAWKPISSEPGSPSYCDGFKDSEGRLHYGYFIMHNGEVNNVTLYCEPEYPGILQPIQRRYTVIEGEKVID